MLRRSLVAVVVLPFVSLCVNAQAAAPKKFSKADLGRITVDSVLRSEVVGEVNRREKLAGALEELSDSPAVRWQAGFIRDGKSWRSFDEFPEDSPDSKDLAEYLSRRRDASHDFADQLSLADWCAGQKLRDQERAHLNLALAAAPADQIGPIRNRLGWRQIGGVWFSSDDLREWQKFNELTQASLHRWQGRLTQIATKGMSGSARQREAALAALMKITDPDVVPALEWTFAGFSEEAALIAVEAIRHIDGPVASLILARQGVFSQWPAVRRRAASALKARRFDDFVPPLISLLATPVRSEMRVTPPPTQLGSREGNRPGWQRAFMVSYVLSRETGDEFQVATIRTPNDQTNAQRAVEQMNAETEELNRRIGAVLGTISGKDPKSGPQVWWDWWHAESDTQLAAGKATVVVTENDILGQYSIGSQVNYDCLAAGTRVWAERGLVPIETIAVGDRVLAQDVETGELAYKPVMRTTLRPPKELCALRFNEETIVTTPGHRFWCSGSGWIKSRDLESQSLLHTVTGNTPVRTAKKGETAETYNLVVADFHTYFVGKAGLLCQDVLPPRGTDKVVPGMSRAQAVASATRATSRGQ